MSDLGLDDMTEGYLDGFKDHRMEFPESLSNRGAQYRHGWMNGRDDRRNEPRASAATLREWADDARAKDAPVV